MSGGNQNVGLLTSSSDSMQAAYLRIINETIRMCANMQPAPVLDQIKEKWEEKLREQFAPTSAKISAPVIIRAPEQPRVSRLAGISLNVPPLSTTTTHPTSTSDLEMGGSTPFSYRSHQEPVLSHDWTTKTKQILNEPLCELTEIQPPSGAPVQNSSGSQSQTDDKTRPLSSLGQKTNAFVAETSVQDADDDDDEEWGEVEWNEVKKYNILKSDIDTPDKSQLKTTSVQEKTAEQMKTTSAAELGGQIHVADNVPNLPSTREVEKGRQPVTSQSAYGWDNPDTIDSDLDNVSDFEEDCDVLINPRDVIVGEFESVQRPHAKKTLSRGLWKLTIKNGIIQIGNETMFFNTMVADLDF